MLDPKLVCENIDEVIKRLNTRNGDFSYLENFPKLYKRRNNLIKKTDELKNKRNTISKKIGEYKRLGKDPKPILNEVGNISEEIKKQDLKLSKLETRLRNLLLKTPNLPASDTPIGKSDIDNVEIKKYGEPTKFNFKIKDHVDLALNLNLLNFDSAAKVTASRFVYNIGLGARLERALIQFMMDVHSKNGYIEALAPYIVNEESMFATGQLPKFKEDSFKLQGRKWYLNPTAEVPMINMYRDQIIKENLPLKYTAYTTAFRQEAGSAGKDTRGIFRQHQFNKVELIKFTTPESSYEELKDMLNEAELILKLLKLPYRVVRLSTGDMGFSMAATYDIEVWIPSQNKYREISSVSNAEDYQARRANIRFKRDKESKPEYVHTLNGSGLAVGRTLIAILENYQQEDGTIKVPDVLIPYMHTDTIK